MTRSRPTTTKPTGLGLVLAAVPVAAVTIAVTAAIIVARRLARPATTCTSPVPFPAPRVPATTDMRVLATPTVDWDTRNDPHALVTGRTPDRHAFLTATGHAAGRAGWTVLTDPAAAADTARLRYASQPIGHDAPVLLLIDTDPRRTARAEHDLLYIARSGRPVDVHILHAAPYSGAVPTLIRNQLGRAFSARPVHRAGTRA